MNMSVPSDKISPYDLKKSKNTSGDDEMDIYIITQEDDKFTEVNFRKEISLQKESQTSPKIDENRNSFLEMSRKDLNQLKLSTYNIEKFEKIIQQSDDDKIANILNVIEELNKTLWGLRETRGREDNCKSKEKTRLYQEAQSKNVRGIRIEIEKSSRVDNTEFVKVFDDLREFGLVLKK